MRSRLVALLWLISLPAYAQVTTEPVLTAVDPKQFATGWFAEGELGAVHFLGPAGGPLSTGVAVGARVGYDLQRWFSVAVHALGSTHAGNVAGAPQSDQLMQFYALTTELKLTYTFRQVSLLVLGSAGLGRVSTNLLETVGATAVGVRSSFAAGGGGGVEYHTLNRHLSVGLLVTYLHLTGFGSSGALAPTALLRYTF